MGVIRARCGDKEMKGACSVVRLREEGGGTATNVGNISKRAGKIIRKGEKEKGTSDDIGQGRNKLDMGKLWDGKKCREQFTGGMTGMRHGLDFGRG